MGDIQSQSWLIAAFIQAMKGIGATADETQLRSEAYRLAEEWSSDKRTFYNLTYLTNVLNRIDEVDNLSHNPDILRVAAWYHLVVFIPDRETLSGNRQDNCHASAVMAERQLRGFGISESTCQEVVSMIMSQACDCSADNDVATFQDVVISYLGTIPQDYKAIADSIRKQYPDLSDVEYAFARREAIADRLKCSEIFHTASSDELETLARLNLEKEWRALNRFLGKAVGKDAVMDLEEPVDKGKPSAELLPGATVSTDTGAIVIKAKAKSGPIPQQSDLPVNDDQTPTPVMGVPVQSSASSDEADDIDVSSTLESAVDFLDSLPDKNAEESIPPMPQPPSIAQAASIATETSSDSYPEVDPDELAIYGNTDPDEETLI